jgi:hypothetical protein
MVAELRAYDAPAPPPLAAGAGLVAVAVALPAPVLRRFAEFHPLTSSVLTLACWRATCGGAKRLCADIPPLLAIGAT